MSEASTVIIDAGLAASLAPGARKLVFVPGSEAILVLNVEGAFHALENSCPHAGASLASGACEGHVLKCPAHGIALDVRSGQCVASPGMRITTYDAKVTDGRLLIHVDAS